MVEKLSGSIFNGGDWYGIFFGKDENHNKRNAKLEDPGFKI